MSGKRLYIIKIGTSSLTDGDGRLDTRKLSCLVGQVADVRDAGDEVVIVTSGSIAAGFHALGYASRPSGVSAKQASAAVGQGLLMEEYTKYLSDRGYVSAQVLLTRDDFTDRRRYKNAFSALELLIARGAVPVVNENDTVAVDELRVGDNDTLSAQVAAMMHADLLIILTDTDGLYTKDPSKKADAVHIDRVDRITPEIEAYAGAAGSANGTGGMITKLRGADLATRAGTPVLITSSKIEDVIKKAVAGEARGTLFTADGSLRTKQQWTAFYAPSRGNVFIDRGAADAVVNRGGSLLSAGIAAVEGDFDEGDVVTVFTSGDHKPIGRGIARMPRASMAAKNGGIAIHKDDLVLTTLSIEDM